MYNKANMKSEITRLEDGTITIKITVPSADVEKERAKVKAELSKHVSAPGFRKGNVPKKIADERLPKATVQEETLKNVVPDAYNEVVKKENLHPIISPKLHIEIFDEGTDLVFEAVTAEEPKVELGEYQAAVKKVTRTAKKVEPKIIVPGKEGEQKEDPKGPVVDDVLEAALQNAKILVPKVLVEEEANRLLTQMVDELKRLGMTLDQYLAARGQTAEEVRIGYEAKAQRDLQLEFLLKAIADKENIAVEEKDITEALSRFQDPKNREEVAKNPYFLAALIRQQKTIDFLMQL
jgi:FKBP-type peptidyl-prolyl cis-trans isomerase (trigger factor)